jgi:hypothetical protein
MMAPVLPATMPYTPPARIQKALALADLLDAAQIESRAVEVMADLEWRLLAQAARTRKPSGTTREMVLGLLRNREAARAIFALRTGAGFLR